MGDDMKGALFFSDKEIDGYFVIGGVEFAIHGHRVNNIRADVKVRRRDGKEPKQLDLIDDTALAKREAALSKRTNEWDEMFQDDADKWRAFGPVKQAVLCCKQPAFWAFLREQLKMDTVSDETSATIAVRDICCVDSRAELGKPGKHRERMIWHNLDADYQAWRLVDHG